MSKVNDDILAIQTGGTLDSEQYYGPGYNLAHPPKYVATLKGKDSLVEPTFRDLFKKHRVTLHQWSEEEAKYFVDDSQKFTYQRLELLADRIRKSEQKYIVLMHGTDGMVDNAIMLEGMLRGSGKVLILAGAMVPLSMEAGSRRRSDIRPNMEYTLENIRQQPEGVYVVGINKQIGRREFMDPHRVKKDRDESLATLETTFKPYPGR